MTTVESMGLDFKFYFADREGEVGLHFPQYLFSLYLVLTFLNYFYRNCQQTFSFCRNALL
jgi:hypothetical protein